jgi:phage terminase small subunit
MKAHPSGDRRLRTRRRSAAALTPKQARFVQEYLVDANATQAAIRAGYRRRRAAEVGYQLLQKTPVKHAIAKGQAATAAKLNITAERIAREVALLAFANMLDYIAPQADGSAVIDLSALTRDQAAAIAGFTVDEYMDGSGDDARPVKSVKFKLHDKLGALTTLAKLLGFWRERSEVDAGGALLKALESIEAKRAIVPTSARPAPRREGGRYVL